MPITGPVPDWLLSIVAAATLFTVMFDLGLAIRLILALLVATLNKAPPAITAAVLAYFVIAALTLVPYVAWRRRAGTPAVPAPPR